MVLSAVLNYFLQKLTFARFAEQGELMVVSITFVVIGAMIALIAVLQFKRLQTTIDPLTPKKASKLAQDGIFKWSRNPMYVGMLVVLGGVVLYFGNILGVATTLFFVIYITYFQIMPEERALEVVFGDEFQRYKNDTRRWL
jgi:protein-S-isoprenylcysteine O-methyltransferase Ste14